MIAKKMKDLVANGSTIRAMFEEGKQMAEKYGKENVYDFSLGNPNTPPPETVKKAAISILQEEEPVQLHGYMSNAGYEDVRDILAKSLNRQHQMQYTRSHIIMTVGAAGALNVALKTILEPKDEVVLLAPFFGEYIHYVENFQGVPVVVPPDLTHFSINFEALEAKLTPKTKALIVNTPNNPTGVIYSEADLQRLAALLERKQKEYGHAIYLISDEPYREIVFGGQTVPFLPKFYQNTFVGYSYSKSLSLPGERIGYLVVHQEMEDAEETMQAASVANRILGFVNAPSLMQRVIGRCAEEVSDMTVYQENKEILYRELTAMGFEMIEPQGAFYMFPKSPIPDEKAFCEAAKKYRILLVPGSTFACPGYFRLAFCVSKETVLNSLEGFRQLAQEFGLSGACAPKACQ